MSQYKCRGLQVSLLDKLIDDNPQEPEARDGHNGAGLNQVRANVRRDLENLLNAKVPWQTWPACYRELDHSLVNYGLQDFSSMAVGSLEGRQLLCQKVADAIKRFEPRFIEVEVATVDNEQPLDRILRLRISALLYADPEPEYICFDSEVEPVHLGMKVQETEL
ncbi:type VI secretion system baseplate subunit TssE [Thalassomonas viridans]|uniref:Type VI secretion system baseplate subunit TssE n=1 Tax=Thalassomonas viridans TaxID=137584 RepID=A0AAF0C7L0_9GAMM|nr:type VI secretion system baseplate subunit TssE [Thalassomonas viridans]WDE03285.1 type VI secretion system baseplate subunit TssE [Thalassomonas viridans]